jgi:MoxR-like ATPase
MTAAATPNSPFATLQPGAVQELGESPGQARAWHQWSAAEIDALTLAYAARRPLLVRGEPGTGKTQLARAAADALGWRLHAETIHPRFEPPELLARFDAVRRLADAAAEEKLTDLTRYWRRGVLWKAFGWESAQRFLADGERGIDPAAPAGHVVLIDEIDKADSDLPNSLLEVLAQRSFRVEPLPQPIGGPNAQPPLIVITTNEERELPAAFLRRCIVLTQQPGPGMSYRDWLVRRGAAHFAELPADPSTPSPPRAELIAAVILEQAADQLVSDRQQVSNLNLPPPGLAEYLDLLYALHELFPGQTGAQRQWLGRLSAYGYLKQGVVAGQSGVSQTRAPIDGLAEAPAENG